MSERDQSEYFMKPSQSFFDSFKGCDVRQLLPVTGISRIDFLNSAQEIIEEAVRVSRESGADEKEQEMTRRYAIRQVAESSLFYFCVMILNLYFVNTDYGYRLCLDVQYNKWNKLWVISREFLKSTIITEASTLWELVKDPNQTYCIYSYKQDMAMKFLAVIKGWCETNTILHTLWPDIFWDNPAIGHEDLPNGLRRSWTWTATAIELKRSIESKEKTIEVAGVLGSSKTGAHFSRQIFDDTETQKNVETPDAIDKLLVQTLMAFNTGQTDHLEYCFVGTFYERADVYYRMIKQGVFQQSVIQPCVDEEGYPIYFSKEQLEKKYKLMGPAVFATQMMCDPSYNSISAFKAEWIRKWDPDMQGLNVYTIVDPASGKTGRKHDFTTIWTVGIDSNSNILVLDLIRDKIGLEKKFSELNNVIRIYHPLRIYYEQVSMQQDISSLEMLMDKYHTRFALTPFNPTKWGDKMARIGKLLYSFETGQVWLPRKCFHVNYQGEMEDMMNTFYLEEYLGYPSIPHDDGLDGLASVYHLLTEKQLQVPEAVSLNKKNAISEINEDQYDPMSFAVNGGYSDEDRFDMDMERFNVG